MLALALAAWMLFKFYSERGTDIVVTFDDGSGLLERKTLLKYKGIVVGNVTKIQLHNENISKVDVTISVDSDAIEAVARKGNEFWKVKPKVTLTEVSGLETIVGGLYIEIYPAKTTFEELYTLPEQYAFTAATHKPFDQLNPGIKLILKDKTGAFGVDTPIIYKKFIVGSVVERELSNDGVTYTVHIEEKYKKLIKRDSHFWGIDGVDFKASMAGIKLKVDSLATLIAGGITFDSSDSNTSISCCDTDTTAEFQLYRNKEAIEYDQKNILLTGEKAYNLDPELSGVYYKGIRAGVIDAVNYNPKDDTTQIALKLKKKFSKLVDEKAYFWIVEPKFNLSGISGLDAITKGAYITFLPKKGDLNPDNHYRLHVTPPANNGKRIHLRANEIGALRVGSGLFYNDIETGYISDIRLAKDKKSLDLTAVIESKHVPLLNDSSLFYLRKSIESDISLSGIKVKVGSLTSMLQGGIAFDTNDFDTAHKKSVFTLYGDYLQMKKARYFNDGGRSLVLHASSTDSLKVGAPLYYNRFKAGEIRSINYNEKRDEIDIEVYVEKRFAHKINGSSRFYNVSGIDISLELPKVNVAIESLQSVVSGAMAFITPDRDNNESLPEKLIVYENRKSAEDDAYHVLLTLESVMNLRQGSQIYYKGVAIGEVSALRLSEQGVTADLAINKEHKTLMRKDSLISLSTFELGLEGVKNAASLISGPSLHVSLGRSSELGTQYLLNNILLHQNSLREGLRIVVSADRKSSLKVGSPVLFRQIKIGDVEEFRLSDNATQVEFSLFIEPCYAHLVRGNSRFYNASALGVEIGLGGVKVKTETLQTMIEGGIVLATPDEFDEQAKSMQVFKLYNEPEDIWLQWHPRLSSSNPMCH
jgi:paraquat-inducible protein B